ncbi:MAG: PEP-CTERM sorting domain-containing protein [Phycisphaeraceae bacterium]
MLRMTTAAGLALTMMTCVSAHAQLLLNEANSVGADRYLEFDLNKPYEGYDFGTILYSGNTNPVNAPVSPGNPFPDVDARTPEIDTTLPNGWAGSTGWARVLGNAGDWIELVVTTDHADLRGWTLYWENDEVDANGNAVQTGLNPGNLLAGEHPDERGFIKFTQNDVWSNLRQGTIITISEQNTVIERRDLYPTAPGGVGQFNTGFSYDLSTDLSYSPKDGDWHIHLHLDENLTDAGQATEYFEGLSDMKVDNDNWRMAIFNASNTALAAQVEALTGRGALDLTTGLVGEFIGEIGQPTGPDGAGYGAGATDDWGSSTGAGGLGNQEVLNYHGAVGTNLVGADSTSDNEDYEDVDFSTFGNPNLFNAGGIENALTGVQDFSEVWAWINSILDGDANLDGTVDLIDLSVLASNFGASAATIQWVDGDFNADDTVDLVDLSLLASNFGSSSPVPEPASLAMLTLGVAAMLRRRVG